MKFVFCLVASLMLSASPSLVSAQRSPAASSREEIAVVRSLRLTRSEPTAFCAASRTSYANPSYEDTYDFKAVVTQPRTGRVTSASGPVVGHLHACFGTTPDSATVSFYAEGTLHGAT